MTNYILFSKLIEAIIYNTKQFSNENLESKNNNLPGVFFDLDNLLLKLFYSVSKYDFWRLSRNTVYNL